MPDCKTYFEHFDGSIAVRDGLIPVTVGMTVYASPDERLIVLEIDLRIPRDSETKTRLHVRLGKHPDPPHNPWVEIH